MVWAAAQELCAILGCLLYNGKASVMDLDRWSDDHGSLRRAPGRAHAVFSIPLQSFQRLPIICQLATKVLYAFAGLFLLDRYELFLCHFCIVIYGSRKGSQGGRYLA